MMFSNLKTQSIDVKGGHLRISDDPFDKTCPRRNRFETFDQNRIQRKRARIGPYPLESMEIPRCPISKNMTISDDIQSTGLRIIRQTEKPLPEVVPIGIDATAQLKIRGHKAAIDPERLVFFVIVFLQCSPTFKKNKVYIDVPGRSNIMFHGGNTAGETKGCIIVASNRTGESVSGDLSQKLYDIVDAAGRSGEPVGLVVKNSNTTLFVVLGLLGATGLFYYLTKR
jgi:hypothetical protein